jgi:hypothetical protein
MKSQMLAKALLLAFPLYQIATPDAHAQLK